VADQTFLVLQRVAGKDASKQFWKYHNESILKKFKGRLQVGSLNTKKASEPTPPPSPPAEKEIVKPSAEPGYVAPMPGKDVKEMSQAFEGFGDLVPYADPSWHQTVCSTTLSADRRNFSRLSMW